MSQTVSRIYQAREDADAAVAELTQTGFPESDTHVVAAGQGSDEELLDSIKRNGVTASHADIYAEQIKRGGTLVSVQAQFGCAGLVTRILEKHRPTDTGLLEQTYVEPPRDPAAPLSSSFGWGVLLDDPAPLSALLGVRVLSTDRPPRRRMRKLVDNPAPLSKALNVPVLSDRPAILSSRFGWRTLLGDPAPLSRRLGWPVLTRNQRPGRFGLRLLSSDPAPLSGLFALKLLTNDPAPLSRLFKWRVLSDDPAPKAEQNRPGSP